MSKLRKNGGELSVDNLDDLVLFFTRITKKIRHTKTKDNRKKLYLIESFYKQFEKQFANSNTNASNIDYKYLFSQCYMLLNICKLWATPLSLNVTDEYKVKFETYFNTKSLDYTVDTFTDSSSLNEALDFLLKFYQDNRKNYQPDYTLFLYRTVYNMLSIMNNNADWFGTQHNMLYNKISILSELIYQLYVPENEDEKNTLEMLKILIFDFKKQCNKYDEIYAQSAIIQLPTNDKDLAE